MRIALCGSVHFAKKIIEIKKSLEERGYLVVAPKSIEIYVDDPNAVEDKWFKLEYDVIKSYFKEIEKSDAVLIINEDKNGIKNYIGGNSLIEMAFGHVLEKKIYLLNNIPQNLSYTNEIIAMSPVVLNGDLSKINL